MDVNQLLPYWPINLQLLFTIGQHELFMCLLLLTLLIC